MQKYEHFLTDYFSDLKNKKMFLFLFLMLKTDLFLPYKALQNPKFIS